MDEVSRSEARSVRRCAARQSAVLHAPPRRPVTTRSPPHPELGATTTYGTSSIVCADAALTPREPSQQVVWLSKEVAGRFRRSRQALLERGPTRRVVARRHDADPRRVDVAACREVVDAGAGAPIAARWTSRRGARLREETTVRGQPALDRIARCNRIRYVALTDTYTCLPLRPS